MPADGRIAYSTRGLAAIYLVHEYTRRLPDGVDTVSYNPGFVPRTDLARDADPVSRFAVCRILSVVAFASLTTRRGGAARYLADVILRTTEAPTGSYVDRGGMARSSEESYDPHREAELWDTAERPTSAHAPEVDQLGLRPGSDWERRPEERRSAIMAVRQGAP